MGVGKAMAIRELDPNLMSAGMMSGGALGVGGLTGGVAGGMSRASGTLEKAADPFTGSKAKLFIPALNSDAGNGLKSVDDVNKT